MMLDSSNFQSKTGESVLCFTRQHVQFCGWCLQESPAGAPPPTEAGRQRPPHLWNPVSPGMAGQGDGPSPPENPTPHTARPWLSPTSLRRLQVLHDTPPQTSLVLVHLQSDGFFSRPESRRKRLRPKTPSSRC